MVSCRRAAGAALAVLVLVLFFGGCGGKRGHSTEKGTACWYGGDYQGKRTASGEIFDEGAMTAAHRSLPFGTIVLVKNLNNGRTVKVRINDRGPNRAGRVIDVSRAAAAQLDMIHAGLVPVRIEVLKWGGRR